ncbi:hypothetical protein ENKNEFLB_00682 [Nocardioides aquaticus]|uniref:Polysaccharide biosynthesis enzyme WcbI domain-containing protein n=2 Tax=Nocardioides aquaticus TaxID=160826 RepID=A0ABX8ED30_9ACTN|nr:WcbI family polysaccharide biosynthesis putative acetyltransferase [Nocardioides aquaticus]QVT78309.1 hypothetical protein ENKNEFLB_00682 [Nocardioides aquaticus]
MSAPTSPAATSTAWTAARTPAERAHYGDFYDGPPAPPEGVPLLAVLGNCQAESLRLVLQDDDVRTVRLPALHELGPGDLEPLHRLLPRLDLLVSQPVGEDYRGLPLGTAQVLDRARPDLRHVLVPPVRHAGPYPCHLVVHPPGLADPDPPLVAYHDVRTAVRAAWLRAGRTPPPVGAALGPAPDAATVAAVCEDSRAQLALREARHGTLVAHDLLLAPTFAHLRTVNHPGNALLKPLGRRVRTALGLTDRPTRVARPLLDHVHAPREASVAAVLDPAAPARDHWLLGGRPVPVAEVEAAHLAWYATRPDVLDVVLARSVALRGLLGLELPGGTP